MAERRMFAKTIIDSDVFIDMPVTARLLYYDLSMRADDDGFVNAPKKIMRMIGASQDDLSVLIMRKFILPFDNGIVVIKHWRIHNYIRKDTYNETKYSEQKALLEFDENKAYRFRKDEPSTECIRVVDEPSTQVRLGKDRLGKDRLGKDRLGKDRIEEKVDCQQIVDLYNDTCVSFPKVVSLSESRKKAIKARLRTYRPVDFQKMFEMAEESRFLKGGNDRNWTATFDWMIKDSNMAKILEGNYKNRTAGKKAKELDEFYGIAKDWAESEGTNE